MEDIFISHIHINEVRHLKNIDIPLSEEKRQHLILTGKNGSGKTSVLEQLKIQCQYGIQNNAFNNFQIWNDQELNLKMSIKNSSDVIKQYQKGNFILGYLDAKRTSSMKKPTSIQKIDIKDVYSISDKPSVDFIQHIVNLKADRSFAKDDNDTQTISDVDNWFIQFENSLKQIFNEQNLKLRFDRKKYSFDIVLNGHDAFDFMTLSDGYSAVLSIVTEIMMRMESKSSRNYNIQGIVFIDEIETHLHIDLQKKILPFLTSFFPKIQFIVTTHSPFVLTSVDNAVVFDLEKQIKLENLSGYSSEAIVESYFESDKYSDILKAQIKRYEMLLNKANPTFDEEEEIDAMRLYFDELPKFLAPELQLTINQLELAHLKL